MVMDQLEEIEITSGKHKGENNVVTAVLEDGIKEVLTLGGLIYCDATGKEVCPSCKGKGVNRSIFGIIRCPCTWKD